ncbi:glycosyltransferase family 4 protein [Stieleria marina]|uniref:Glycogen synthase n=1 Tax=Stieleria marina TaxID=1930275 RepID=A0A517NXP8_9BACT|nr:Glycogen synthase [Planctomycetes bacterium K23_9]
MTPQLSTKMSGNNTIVLPESMQDLESGIAAPTDDSCLATSDATPDDALPKQPVKITTRVLHVVNGEHFSGAERVQSHLGRCLPRFGVAADFACVKPGSFSEMVHANKGQWGRCFDTEMTKRFDLRPVLQLKKLVQTENYDLLHAHTPRTAMITSVASRMLGIPWVYHVHSPTARDSARPLANQINAWTEKLSLSNCSHLITVSHSLRDDCIHNGFAEHKVTVVHNGVPEIRPARTATPQPNGEWVIGMIALMRPRKGLDVALDAIAELKDLNVKLRIIGPFETSGYESIVNEQIQRLGIQDRIERVGFVDDVPAELSKLDAMVLPSLFGEGLPMVVLESMAAAVPVIATRVEGTPEAITDGVEGLLAEPNDAGSLSLRIRELATGKYDWTTLSEAAFRRHAAEFSDTAMASGTAKVYDKLLSDKR